MAINFYAKPILATYRVGNNFIFTDKASLCCYFNAFAGGTEVQLTLGSLNGDEIDDEQMDLGDIEIPNTELNGNKIEVLKNFELCGSNIEVLVSKYYGHTDAVIAFCLNDLLEVKENLYQPIDEEKTFLKRVLCLNEYDENEKILDLNKVAPELEKFICKHLLRPYQDEYVAKSSRKITK
jgi:hypothetical protein